MTAWSGQRRALLFLMQSPAYVRNFEPVLRELSARGHETTVVFEERKPGGEDAGLALIDHLCGECKTLRYEFMPPLPLGLRVRVRLVLEAGQDYLRYFDPPYRGATRLRSRALGFLPAAAERLLALALRRWPALRRALRSAARRVNETLGDERRIRGELERRRPGALVVTPMVQFRSRQSAWVRTARGQGIGTMLCVHSWDNLTNKGLMHVRPDRVTVWNDAQRREAIELHGVAPDSVVVTGAWPYEHWSGWRTSRSRAELCRQLGLPADRAIVLYVCSSRFIAERERPAVSRWVRALRSSEDPRLATANVIVRPHPLNGDEWSDRALPDLPGVAVFPPGGAEPVDTSSRADYFDSIAHADAVVGVNTSALIETAILDRPALALPAAEFRFSQEEVPHFRLLVGERGMLTVADSIPEHIEQLSRALGDASAGASSRRRFVDTFIRPGASGASPSARVVAAVEELLDPARAAGSATDRAVARMHA